MALKYAMKSTHRQFVVYSDSMSCLQAIQCRSLDNSAIIDIFIKHERLIAMKKSVTFFWVPSHVGIMGNERADSAAIAALSGPLSHFKVPACDFRYSSQKYTRGEWQITWSQCVNNKLFAIKPLLGVRSKSYRKIRREEIMLSRIRIGHSHLTHSYLL